MKKIWLFSYILFLSGLLFLGLDTKASNIDEIPTQLVVINEVMISNQTIAPDYQGDYNDWIELYNPHDIAVDLSGYFISDRYGDIFLYELPRSTIIQPKGFLLIFASGKDGVYNQEIHTNFALNQAGEPIILSNRNGRLIDYLAPKFIPSNMSYGRFPDGSDQWAYFNYDEATPNQSNNQAIPQVLPKELNPLFSHKGGFYETAFSLELQAKPQTTIYYTTDGSDPTTNDLIYNKAIFIEKQTIPATGDELRIQKEIDMDEIPVPYAPLSHIRSGSQRWKSPTNDTFKATVIKARAFDHNGMSSEVVTHTYFVDPNMSEKYQFPVMSISTDINHLFSYETGINVPGIHYDPTILEEGSGNRTGNYFQRGDAWERPIFIEYFEADGALAFSQNAGIRIHGGLSRKYPIKSYRLYARSSYDEANSSFNHPFFEDKPIDEFKRLILRGGGQAYQYTFMGEAAAQELIKPLDIDIQYNQPVILFINGEYFGIRNIRDRLDEWHLSIHYGGNPEQFTLLTGNAYLDSGSIEGQRHYLDLYMTVTRNNMNDDYYYNHVKTQMDIDNFIDYYIAQLYIANLDWPQNNILYWRYNIPAYDPNAPKGLDGRWRWMVFDVDAGFAASWGGNKPEINSFERLTGDNWRTGNMFTSLLRNDAFRAQYINRFADLLNTHLSQDVATELVKSYKAMYQPEMQEHIDRWGYPSTYNTWLSFVNRMEVFAKQRPEHLISQMIDHYDLGGTHEIRIYTNLDQGTVQINSLVIDQDLMQFNHFSGIYFENVPVKLKALPQEGYRFKGWYNQLNQLISLDLETEVKLSRFTNVIARFEEGDHIIPGDDTSYFDERIVLYISVFIMSTVVIIGFVAEYIRRNHRITS